MNPRHEPLDQAGAIPVTSDVADEEFEDLNFDKLTYSDETIEDWLVDASKIEDTGTSGGTGSSSWALYL